MRFDDTIHNIKHKEKIPSFVSSRLISRVLSHLTTKIQIILHNERNGFFQVKTHDCSRIPLKVGAGCILIHIGHVYGHYFLIKDKTLLHKLSASDFERFEEKNEELALKIDTLRDPKYFVMRKVGNTILWEDEDLPITDLEIQKRIKSYQKQDEKAGREVDTTLSVQDVRELLSSKTCSHCSKPIMWSNWTLDRINNSKSHSKNNLVLACYHCNVKKKDKEQEIYTWDTEAHPYLQGVFHELCNWVSEEISNMIMDYIPDSRTHVVYSAGITKFDSEILRKADAGLNGETFDDGHLYTYNDLHTEIFYGESGLDGTNPEGAFFKLENWLINKSEEIRRKVERELNSFLDWYIRNVLDNTEENFLRDNIEDPPDDEDALVG